MPAASKGTAKAKAVLCRRPVGSAATDAKGFSGV
jgi:hypothetical protein